MGGTKGSRAESVVSYLSVSNNTGTSLRVVAGVGVGWGGVGSGSG
jgi:hypothetical protein